MNEQMKLILEKIKEYDRIVIFRHKRPDGDTIGCAAALCAALRETLDHPELAQARAEAARRNLCEHFTWDAVFAKIMEIIKENGR